MKQIKYKAPCIRVSDTKEISTFVGVVRAWSAEAEEEVKRIAIGGEYTIEEIPDPEPSQIETIQKDVDTLKADQQAMWNEMATSYQNGVNKA